MSHLEPDRLSLLAIGESATDAERAHLDTCDHCALELAELEYTVTVGRSTVTVGDLESPPERVWGRIAEELQLSSVASATAADTRDAPSAQDEASVPASDVRTKGRRRKRRGLAIFALAASLALVVAALGTWTLVRSTQPVQVASATLDAFPDHPGASGAATVVEKPGGGQVVEVELDDAERDDGYREVWLITADASALVSLGVLEGSSGEFAVPAGIDLREYVLVDISQEPADGDPAHSGDSIVRGELGFA